MEELVPLIITAIADIPAAVDAVKSALQKASYTDAEIEAIFAEVRPLDQLGINPNHPVKPEPQEATAAPASLPQEAPPAGPAHIFARPPTPAPKPAAAPARPLFSDLPAESATPAPKLPTAQPPPPPFERAR